MAIAYISLVNITQVLMKLSESSASIQTEFCLLVMHLPKLNCLTVKTLFAELTYNTKFM